ncbi:tRNA 2-thiouridine(34) synthase MnmA [Prolixibacteraceae bacterium JC049]|nr:tRNA 2-thiouridine(34) synthase MnmA [Prolixibacteraceae bacterium JC049]
MKKRVLLGMSGGTDSSVAAMLLQDMGCEVVGLTLKLYEESGKFHSEATDEPEYIRDAKALANRLNMEHHVLDIQTIFKEKILTYFADEYLAGRTPFPCVKCNQEIKWHIFSQEADKYNCEKIATGHYARIVDLEGRKYIAAGKDEDKDQAFFLWGMTPELLDRVLFPLGGLTKPEIRQIAAERGFQKVSSKKDSMGICFIEESDYRPFLRKLLKERNIEIAPGNYIDRDGNKLGKHHGFPFYTIGQRRGLDIHLNKRIFVTAIDAEMNTVTIGDYKDLYRREMIVGNYNLIHAEDINAEEPLIVKIRYRNQATPCRLHILSEEELRVELLEDLPAIAVGQSAVFYQQDRVVGGGVIEK